MGNPFDIRWRTKFTPSLGDVFVPPRTSETAEMLFSDELFGDVAGEAVPHRTSRTAEMLFSDELFGDGASSEPLPRDMDAMLKIMVVQELLKRIVGGRVAEGTIERKRKKRTNSEEVDEE